MPPSVGQVAVGLDSDDDLWSDNRGGLLYLAVSTGWPVTNTAGLLQFWHAAWFARPSRTALVPATPNTPRVALSQKKHYNLDQG